MIACGRVIYEKLRAYSRKLLAASTLFEERASYLWSMILLVDHHGAPERDDRLPILVVAGRVYDYDPYIWARARLALLQDFRLGVDRVPLEDWVGEPYLVPSQVGEHVLGDVDYALDSHERQREGRVHQRPAELPLRREVMIEVYGGRVSREQGELEVVRGGHGAPQGVLVDVADLEVLEKASPPSLLDRHATLLLLC